MPDKIDQINKLIKALPLPKKGLYKLKNSIDVEDFNILLQSKEGKIYTADGSSFSGGGGSSALLPNGKILLTETTTIDSSFAGKLISLEEDDIQAVMQNASSFNIGDNIGFTTEKHSELSYVVDQDGNDFYIGSKNDAGEIFIMTVSLDEYGSKRWYPVSSGIITDHADGLHKTYFRYLIDNVGGGGGGSSFITKTKAEIDALITANELVAGALYEITDVHPTLYDDGTTSGTTIYLRAISGNQLEVQGMGKFYNPKYNQAVDGFGIWDNKMYGTFSTIVGTFDYQNKETVTSNNGATGILLADGMIQFVSGNWSSATSITGGTSGATANVVGFVTPSYSIGDKVIWGGYSWTNVNGNVGTSTDVLNLDSEWSKNVYDTTNYNLAYDLIEYDYANDMIIRRHDLISNIDVRFDKETAGFFTNVYSIPFNAISVQQFGNPFSFTLYKGVGNKLINNGYDESVNFCGSYQSSLTFGSSSYQSNLTFGNGSYQSNLTFGNGSYQSNLTFGSDSFQYNLTFGRGSYQSNLTFGNGPYQSNLTFGSDSFQYNLTFGSGSNQYNLTFGNNSYQINLTFNNSSNQSNLTFRSGSQLNYNSQVISSNMEYVDFKTKDFTVPNLSSATYIFDSNIKEVYQRPNGTIKLKFMNNSDVLEVHGIAG